MGEVEGPGDSRDSEPTSAQSLVQGPIDSPKVFHPWLISPTAPSPHHNRHCSASGPEPTAPTESAQHRPGYGSYGPYGGYGGYGNYGGYGHGYGPEVPAGQAHLFDYLRALYRHRWTAVTAFIVITVAVTIYTFTATPIFEGRVQLLIEPENPNVISFKEVVEVDKATNEYYQTQYSILKSRALAKRTLTEPQAVGQPSVQRTSGRQYSPGIR